MLVDPNTGMPIGEANTVGGQIGMNALGSAGITNEDIPLGYDMLASLPSATHTTMWNMNRVGRTITKGPRRGLRRSSDFNGGRGFRQNASPFSWGRLASTENIEPSDFGTPRTKGVKRGYTPFNFIAESGNWLTRTERLGIGERMTNAIPSMMRPGQGEYAFSPGTLGRMNTLGRIYSGSDKSFAKMVGNVYKSAGSLNPSIGRAIDNMMYLPSGRNIAGEAVALSARGTVSQTALSYVNAAHIARTGGTLSDATNLGSRIIFDGNSEIAARQAANRSNFAAQKAFEHMGKATNAAGELIETTAGRKALATGASYLPAASKFAGTAGWILLAGDLVKMGAKAMGAGAELALDAGKSVMGSSRKPTFGMGFRDNSVAASARQRGVMAIANSQLNARSVLGNEASSLHAHFG